MALKAKISKRQKVHNFAAWLMTRVPYLTSIIIVAAEYGY